MLLWLLAWIRVILKVKPLTWGHKSNSSHDNVVLEL